MSDPRLKEPNAPPGYARPALRRRRTSRKALVAIIVAFILAGSVIGYVINQSSSGNSKQTSAPDPKVDPSDPYTKPQIAATKNIAGLVYHPEPSHTHVRTTVSYDAQPPMGGDHSTIWADCAGTVYPNAIANENAVHMLEHGTVWITYQSGLAADQVEILRTLVDGVDRMAVSPYPGLKTKISLQSWGYQLFVDDAADPRIADFILALRFNPNATPESGSAGVTCSDPPFKLNPSTFGHPIFTV